eukprot:CAMPEP_0117420034 /NCGR_PEP_ID=MMETSP0758-20121206/1465_1 /TAXON_ID=63605 /ORGANISM="Percolomonas cosmopolitus, Strain AE-1 (ATCC 50343)" /LENGTH=342 /DNA_ID=CAMNT_0005201433 /DNA_START=18 /DNA_END=1046 /DNA_ORIENTATION=-
MSQLCVLVGTSNQELGNKIDETNRSIALSPINIKRFADGEIWCQVEKSVRGQEVYIIQSTSTPVNDNLMELFVIADACRRASAKSITAVMPYFGYARQDRKTKARVPITASLVAKLIESAGVNRVIAVDLHCGQIQGFFPNIPVDNLYGQPPLAKKIFKELTEQYKDKENSPLRDHGITIVSPDAGGAERADFFRKCFQKCSGLKCSMAMMNKKREEHNKVAKMELIGDVKDTLCIIVDDMIDTAGTLCKAGDTLKEAGATVVIAASSHGLFNGTAVSRIHKSSLEAIYVLDTVAMSKDKKKTCEELKCSKIKYVTVASLLGEAIVRTNRGMSIGELFEQYD